jgi:hypothetical protein
MTSRVQSREDVGPATILASVLGLLLSVAMYLV